MPEESKTGSCERCHNLDVLHNVKTKSGIWRWLCSWCINTEKSDD